MLFTNPELRRIAAELSSIRAILERVAVVLEREPERQVDAMSWTHSEPQKEV